MVESRPGVPAAHGCPIGTLYGYVEDGFYDNISEVRSNKAYAGLSDAEAMRHVGEIKYRDLNGDGQITQDDRTIIGNTNPDYTYSFTNNLSYKNLCCRLCCKVRRAMIF